MDPKLTFKWAKDAQVEGIFVQIEEATQDPEIDTIGVLVNVPWARRIVGLVLSGDLAQLGPTVTCKVGLGQLNQFVGRLELTLHARLKQLAFPNAYTLKLQYRMDPDIAEFPNRLFYNGQLSNAECTGDRLEEAEIIKLAETFCAQDDVNRDQVVRLHYHEFRGGVKRKQSNGTSSANIENVQVVMQIVEKLSALYGEHTRENVLLITPYLQQVCLSEWIISTKHLLTRFEALRISDSLPSIPTVRGNKSVQYVPRLSTIDGAQGSEAKVVLLDLVVTEATNKGLGFLKDRMRCNVAFTRAQKALWLFGGQLEGELNDATRESLKGKPGQQRTIPAVVQYRHTLSRKNRIHFGRGA